MTLRQLRILLDKQDCDGDTQVCATDTEVLLRNKILGVALDKEGMLNIMVGMPMSVPRGDLSVQKAE